MWQPFETAPCGELILVWTTWPRGHHASPYQLGRKSMDGRFITVSSCQISPLYWTRVPEPVPMVYGDYEMSHYGEYKT